MSRPLTWLAFFGLVAIVTSEAHAQLVINEVDYDQIGTDNDEFVELRNGFNCSVNVTGLALVFINGANNTEYLRVDLSPAGTLSPGQYLVVGSATVTALLPTGVASISFVGASNNVQNGAPDGIAIVDTLRLTVIDAISYEGPMTAAQIIGFANPVNLVAGTPLSSSVADSNTITGSLARVPNGTDTNNDATDWAFVTTITPGLSNDGSAGPLHTCCGSADFNGDGNLGTDADIEAFFACLSGTCCATCGSADFNGDGNLGTDADIEAFFRVLGGGPC